MFKYDWSKFDARTGLFFAVGVVVVFNAMGGSDFAWYAAGTAALLAWCTILLVPPQSLRRDLGGLGVYLVAGAGAAWLGSAVASNSVALVISMFVVTFAGYMMLMYGAHAFMIAWCVVYWFLLIPLFMAGQTLGGILYAHLIGTGLVIALNALKPLWGAKQEDTAEVEPVEDERPSLGYMLRYAGVVATSVCGGTALGIRWLTADPTAIANTTLNIISPSFSQVWRAAVERVVLGTVGIVTGFYIGWFFPGEVFGQVFTGVAAFAALGFTRVSFSLLVTFLFMFLAYPWGVMHSDAGHLIANEKIIGEMIGMVVAVAAIGLLTRLHKTEPA
jgi:hypothetical protein